MLTGRMLQRAVEIQEDLLGVEVAPDRLAIVVGRVGVLAADDDVGEAVVLAVDAVHHGFLRAAVQHLDVEADQLEDLGEVVAALLPQRLVLVALAEELLIAQRAVAAHADAGRDVVALQLADQRVEHHAGEVALAGELLDAGDQRVLVGAVQWVAGLEGKGALPTAIGDQRARLARR